MLLLVLAFIACINLYVITAFEDTQLQLNLVRHRLDNANTLVIVDNWLSEVEQHLTEYERCTQSKVQAWNFSKLANAFWTSSRVCQQVRQGLPVQVVIETLMIDYCTIKPAQVVRKIYRITMHAKHKPVILQSLWAQNVQSSCPGQRVMPVGRLAWRKLR